MGPETFGLTEADQERAEFMGHPATNGRKHHSTCTVRSLRGPATPRSQARVAFDASFSAPPSAGEARAPNWGRQVSRLTGLKSLRIERFETGILSSVRR